MMLSMAILMNWVRTRRHHEDLTFLLTESIKTSNSSRILQEEMRYPSDEERSTYLKGGVMAFQRARTRETLE